MIYVLKNYHFFWHFIYVKRSFFLYFNLFLFKIFKYLILLGEKIIDYKSLDFHTKFPGSILIQNIKIKEVSSHFIKGWFYFCLQVKDKHQNPNYIENSTITFLKKQKEIKAEEVKPLIIPNVIVRSKERKKRWWIKKKW